MSVTNVMNNIWGRGRSVVVLFAGMSGQGVLQGSFGSNVLHVKIGHTKDV